MSYLALNAAPLDVYDNTVSYINKKTNRTKTQKRPQSFPDQIIDQDKVRQVLESIHGTTTAPGTGNNNNNTRQHFQVEDDDTTELGDYNTEPVYSNTNSNSNNNNYNFPPPPMSAGVARATIKEFNTTTQGQGQTQGPIQQNVQMRGREGMANLGNSQQQQQQQPNKTQGYNAEENIELNNYQNNYPSKITDQEYYKKFVSTVTDEKNILKPYLSNDNNASAMAAIETKKSHEALLQKINYMIHLLEEQKDVRTGSVAEEVILYSFLGIFIIFLADTFSKIGKYKR